MQKSRKKARRKLLALSRLGCIVLFAVVMIIGSVTGLLFFARPSSSALEKRDLTTFPAITVSSFLDGSWFSQISTWYSDTYPGRDSLLAMNRVLQKAQGITPTEQVVGGDHQADEIGKTPAEEEQPKDSQFDNGRSCQTTELWQKISRARLPKDCWSKTEQSMAATTSMKHPIRPIQKP